jgi:hypothetical protein
MALGAFVVLITGGLSMVLSMLMVPIFVISLLGLFSPVPFEMGIWAMCALPWGYVLAMKRNQG